ncbi:MAG: HK97 family phage prohead protease, partial [Planctomycetota bacterium]
MDEFLIIEAAGGNERANARVMGVAYSGGKMKLPGWRHPVVVDLAGLEIPETVPLLTNHENRTGSRVGMVRARVEDDGLVIEGEILSSSGQAKGIIEQAEAGADWQLSIGAEVLDAELVRGSRAVNGRTHAGPFYHVKRSVLREVSVVAVGADISTRMKVAASFHLYGGKTMEFGEWMEQHGIDTEKVDEDRMTELKTAFEAGQDPPSPRLRSASPPEPEPEPEPERKPEPRKVEARTGKRDAIEAVAQAREQAEDAIRAERERVSAIQDICAGEFP